MILSDERLNVIFGILGLASISYAIIINLEDSTGFFFYLLLVIQIPLLLYLLIIVSSKLKEAWTSYRWSPDRLR